MKMKKTLVVSLFVAAFMPLAHASGVSYGNPSHSNASYGNGSNSHASYGDNGASNASYGPAMPPVSVTNEHNHYYDHTRVYWQNAYPGARLPVDTVKSGSQPESPHTLYVCHAKYNGGMHPGKLVGDKCNISYAGRELPMARYQVLVSHMPVAWVSSNGNLPNSAIPGGYEGAQALYICQANYRGGVHSGKVVDGGCNFGWGGREVVKHDYRVLVVIRD